MIQTRSCSFCAIIVVLKNRKARKAAFFWAKGFSVLQYNAIMIGSIAISHALYLSRGTLTFLKLSIAT